MSYLLRTIAALIFVLLAAVPARPYSVLSHEEVVDMAWTTDLLPLLRARFPGISDEALRQAHAYAYGGSVIQDIGYYPFGSHYFSDLVHYVRPNDFVTALLRDSTTPNEYAFALGALAHFCGDTVGHPQINLITALENPPLRKRFGSVVTYEQDPIAHVRTEFGFDVVEVAHGHYSQQNYHDFIGFQVAKALLERAFAETYGLTVASILPLEDLSIATYRRSVSFLIPEMTKIAYLNYKDEIVQAAPGTTKSQFLYRLNKTEYARDYGTDTLHVSFGGHLLAFFIHLLPKVGPLKALKVSIPSAQEQVVYLASVNSSVDQFRRYLAQVSAPPAPLPPPTPDDASAAREAAAQMKHRAKKSKKLADEAGDPADKASKEQVATNIEQAAARAADAANHVQAQVDASRDGAPPASAAVIHTGGLLVEPPTTPVLPELDLDTGKPSAAGEYYLAEETYARLLDDLLKPSATDPHSEPPSHALAADIERYFAHPVASASEPASAKQLKKQASLTAQVQVNLTRLKQLEAQSTAVASR